jgi:hypothetical protein
VPSGAACDGLAEKQRSAAPQTGSLPKRRFCNGEVSQFRQSGRVVQGLFELLFGCLISPVRNEGDQQAAGPRVALSIAPTARPNQS